MAGQSKSSQEGRKKNKPAQKRYTSTKRWLKNRERKLKKLVVFLKKKIEYRKKLEHPVRVSKLEKELACVETAIKKTWNAY